MFKKIKDLLFTKDEEIILSDKTMEIMEILKEHKGEKVRHIVKVKVIEAIRSNIYEAIKADESEFYNKLEEVRLAKQLFELTIAKSIDEETN